MTDAQILKLVLAPAPEPGEPRVNVVEVLEELLADAKAGKLMELALAGVRPGGYVVTALAVNEENRFLLLGATVRLQRLVERTSFEQGDDLDDAENGAPDDEE